MSEGSNPLSFMLGGSSYLAYVFERKPSSPSSQYRSGGTAREIMIYIDELAKKENYYGKVGGK